MFYSKNSNQVTYLGNSTKSVFPNSRFYCLCRIQKLSVINVWLYIYIVCIYIIHIIFIYIIYVCVYICIYIYMYLLVILNKSIFHSILIKTFHSLQNWKPYIINFFFLVQYLFSLKCIFKLFFANFYMYYLYSKVASNDSMCTHTPVLSTFCHTFKNNYILFCWSILIKFFFLFNFIF